MSESFRQRERGRPIPAGAGRTHKLIDRFKPSLREKLLQLERRSPYHGDVFSAFPAISVSLVTGRGTAQERGEAVALIEAGRSLRDVARVLRLPPWARRLSPESLYRGLPEAIAPTFQDDAFGRQVIAHLPDRVQRASAWLHWMLAGRETIGDAFAIWIAKRRVFASYAPARALLEPLMAYAWHSTHHSDAAPPERWTRRMSLTHAAHRTRDWILRLMLDDCAFVGEPRSPWTETHEKDGFAFVPLLTSADFDIEGRAMRHCVVSYKEPAAVGRSRIYGVRRNGEPVATLEVTPMRDDPGTLYVNQMRGRGNISVVTSVQMAAGRWLADRLRAPEAVTAFHAESLEAIGRWRRLFEPYSAATGVRSSFIRYPGKEAMERLLRDLEGMAEQEAFGRKFFRERH